MPRIDSESVKRAKAILRQKVAIPEPAALFDLAMDLKKENHFGYARKLLRLARTNPDALADTQFALKLAQEQALCTYKDPDLPIGDRLDSALELLDRSDDLRSTRNQETLGLAGAIFKRKWEVSAQKIHLERSLSYYLRGYDQDPKDDCGYTGINAAFVLDQLASLEADSASPIAESRRAQARQIREHLVAVLPELAELHSALEGQYWFLATVAEAFFGLQQYDPALSWLQKAAALGDLYPWQLQSTAQQLAALARLQPESRQADAVVEQTDAWKTLQAFLGNRSQAARTAFLGKVGLALSGGGFRASLFHIGVLAKLAELDMLRHVEVISCVSGGSIIGAHYYLEIRNLLRKKPDQQITRDDYVEIVERICDQFLEGVQRNIRTRVAAEFVTNLKMIFAPHYSRTQRAGELYEEEIYSRIGDGEDNRPRWVNDLFIQPADEDKNRDFAPKYENWRRAAKVPILILNATTLNTGHNWQFTASWMGEPPIGINTAIDANYRLRRMYYHEAPDPHKRIRLGHAVAASACVPGLFEPIVLPNLYQRDAGVNRNRSDITVRLVDGGVHDNQGIMGLLEQDCQAIIVSDASGQMESLDNPSKGIVGVPLRSNSILMARVREAEYREMAARLQSSLLRNVMYIHLKKDLEVLPVDWIGCQDPPELPANEPNRPKDITSYGILKKIQQQVAAIRTDLDSFCDEEAFALMTSAYRMTECEFPRRFGNFPTSSKSRPDWRFLKVEPGMTDPTRSDRLAKLLGVSSKRALKIWLLSTPLKIAGIVLLVAALAGFLWACWKWSTVALVTLGTIGSTVTVLLAGAIVGKTVMRAVQYRETVIQIAIGVGMALLGWILARIHLHVFDKLYLHAGRVKD